jgi:tetratricopeptide (TPR) repeat protein
MTPPNAAPTAAGRAGGEAAQPAGDAPSRHLAWMIFLPFAALSLLAFLLLQRDYRLGSNLAAIQNSEAEKHWADAIPHLQKMLKLDPKNQVEWRRRLGWAYLNDGQYQPALEHFEAAKRLDPNLNLAEPWMICYYTMGRNEEGRTCRDQVLKDNPRNAAANYYLGRELLEQGKYALAGTAFRLVALDPLWNERAATLRRRLAEKIFGTAESGATTTTATYAHDLLTSPAGQSAVANPARHNAVTTPGRHNAVATPGHHHNAATSPAAQTPK